MEGRESDGVYYCILDHEACFQTYASCFSTVALYNFDNFVSTNAEISC